jgi:hypothetical protein
MIDADSPDHDVLAMESDAMIAYDRENSRLLIGLEAIPFNHNFGMFVENRLIDYFDGWIGGIVPLFDLACDYFLGSILNTISQACVSLILGPNRLSVYYLDHVHVTAGMEMKTAREVLDVLSMSAGRPVVVGHGANGLLTKAAPFEYDPWRISFEAPKLDGSPMATVADATETDNSRIVNFHSETWFYASLDDAAITNTRIPYYNFLRFVPANPWQMLCFVVAACGNDTRFDHVCKEFVGMDDFEEIWKLVGRQRIVGKE